MKKTKLGFYGEKLAAYLVIVAPIVGFSFLMIERYNEKGCFIAVAAGMLWLWLLLQGDDEKTHTFLKQLVMRWHHYKDM